jgi:phage portal protein BeeE
VASDGLASSYIVQNDLSSTVFNRVLDKGRIRYVADGNKEIFQTRNFNADRHSLVGVPPLSAISVEISQVREASNHNLAMLRNGARPSGVFSTEKDLNFSDEQYKAISEQFNNGFSGSSNAGKQMFLDNGLKYINRCHSQIKTWTF